MRVEEVFEKIARRKGKITEKSTGSGKGGGPHASGLLTELGVTEEDEPDD